MSTSDQSVDRTDALRRLDFGKVDGESEADLDRRFVRTSDFDAFTSDDIWLALGAKGTGKSALFELLTRHEAVARSLVPGGLQDVLVAAGTGFADLSEVATPDLESLRTEDGYDHERLWRLYIAVKAGLAVKGSKNVPAGPLRELLIAVGERRDFRIGPLLKSLWKFAVGAPPGEVTISAGGASVTLRGGARTLDVVTLLEDVQATLEADGKRLWILFDKIDEIYPSDRDERLKALEGLMTACMGIRRQFPRVQPKVLLRTDLYRHLNFTNKSHLTDKRIELRWSRDQLAALLLKRAATDDVVWEVCAERVPRLLEVSAVEDLSPIERETALEAVLPSSAYPGQNEARIVDWIVARVTDAQGTVLPREAILFGKQARARELERGGPMTDTSLISREAVRDAFADLSAARCESYLAEFPELKEHFRRFRGQTSASFTRAEMAEMMDDLAPSGDELLQELFDIGVLTPIRGDVKTAAAFEVPRLYRVGLGLVIRGRA